MGRLFQEFRFIQLYLVKDRTVLTVPIVPPTFTWNT